MNRLAWLKTWGVFALILMGLGGASQSSAQQKGYTWDPIPGNFTSSDIGPVRYPGKAGYRDGEFTITGSGGNIWGGSDEFQFVYTNIVLCTNCDIRARVRSVEDVSAKAKAAVMIRESLAPDSSFALVDVTPRVGIESIFRASTGGQAEAVSVSGQAPPNWVRLTRSNDVFTACWSEDGKTWKKIGQTIIIPMAGTGAYVGPAVCAHNSSISVTAAFDSLAISVSTNAPAELH
jgi:hypothetical protein